jgi:hypothetical protein
VGNDWLQERPITYIYKLPDGTETYLTLAAKFDPPETHEGGTYAGYLPDKIHMTFKISYEQNGRAAYKYDTGNGKPRYVSATRERYEKVMGNTGNDKLKTMKAQEKTQTVYSRGFEKHLKEQKEKKRR